LIAAAFLYLYIHFAAGGDKDDLIDVAERTRRGNYFGVPISSYFGWFLVVFIFFQIFTLYLSKFDVLSQP
jgi:hypothetical protein